MLRHPLSRHLLCSALWAGDGAWRRIRGERTIALVWNDTRGSQCRADRSCLRPLREVRTCRLSSPDRNPTSSCLTAHRLDHLHSTHPILAQMWQGRAQSSCRCGSSVPSLGVQVWQRCARTWCKDVAAVAPGRPSGVNSSTSRDRAS